MRLWLCAMLILILPAPALAGAWLQDERTGFLSVSGTLRDSASGRMQEGSVYATYGLRPRLTLGFDAFHDLTGSGHVLLFARLPLGRGEGPARMSVELGLGGHHKAGTWAPMAKAALGWGRSLEGRLGQGWLDLSGSVEHRAGEPALAWKLDATLGLSGEALFRPMLQAGLGRTTAGGSEWRASAHLLIGRNPHQTWVLGIERKDSGGASTALSLALWRRF